MKNISFSFLSLIIILSIFLSLHFLSSYHLLVLESDFYSLNILSNDYPFASKFLEKFLNFISNKANINIVNSFFIFKILCLSLISFIVSIFFKDKGIIYYTSIIVFSFFVYDFLYYIPMYWIIFFSFLSIFIFLRLQNHYILRNIFLIFALIIFIFYFLQNNITSQMDIFHNLKINKDIYIPAITLFQEKIKLYQILIIASIFLISLLKVYFKSSYIYLILIPSIIFSLYTIFSYMPKQTNDINHKVLDTKNINNSIIFSLQSDKQKVKYYFNNNIFIHNDYIFSDIISTHKDRAIHKMKFYSSYYQKDKTAENVFTKGIQSPIKKENIYLYINKNSLANLKVLFAIASFDVFKNKTNEVFMEVAKIIYTLDENKYYKKSISKKLYLTNKFRFDLSKGEIYIKNKQVKINNAFLVDNDGVKKIDYENKAKSPFVSIIIKNKYIVICHKDYVKSFFIQAVLFKNYPSENIDEIYNENGDVILRYKQI